jgi:hypothetical protein
MARLRVLRLDVDRQAVRAEDGRGCRPDRSDNDVLGERSAQVGLDSRIRGDLKETCVLFPNWRLMRKACVIRALSPLVNQWGGWIDVAGPGEIIWSRH